MKVKELHHSLQTEKASRTDLEMYVAVLNTQKGVLQEDVDKLRSQLHERKPQSWSASAIIVVTITIIIFVIFFIAWGGSLSKAAYLAEDL